MDRNSLGRNNSVLTTELLSSAKTEEKYQATIVSIASSSSRLIYIPIVLITNYFGNTNPQYILLATMLIFSPLTLLAWIKLRGFKSEHKKK